MSLDLQTFIIGVFMLAIAGALLLLSWLHHRSNKSLAQWAFAFFLGAVGIALIGARGRIPDAWSILAANALLTSAYGVMWQGVRTFEGRRSHPALIGAGAVIWLTACAVPAFYAVGTARALLIMAISMAYSLAAAAELWRGRSEPLPARWPLIVILIVHAATLPLRVPLVSALNGGPQTHPLVVGSVIFETLLFCICGVYLLGSLSKERLALRHEQTSLLDPLTGVANRRAFLGQGAKIIDRAEISGQPTALLLFDLDRFKSVNDQYGHATGDDLLRAFCRVATTKIRRTDLFARLGGEEFACLLPNASQSVAMAIAEEIRNDFAAMKFDAGSTRLAGTVSVGMSATDRLNSDLPSLLIAADRALYRAKQEGRNRVVAAAFSPPVLRGRRRGSPRSDNPDTYPSSSDSQQVG